MWGGGSELSMIFQLLIIIKILFKFSDIVLMMQINVKMPQLLAF